MKASLLFLTLLAVLCPPAQATVADDIAAIEAEKARRLAQDRPLVSLGFPQGPVARSPRPMVLQDGRQVDMNDYAIVVFMQQNCKYSAKFDPQLKAWTDEQGIKVYPYTLDGYGDAAFPSPLIPRKAGAGEPIAGEILTFFGSGLPIATPTTFMVNVHTNKAYPLVQGDTDMLTLSQRLGSMIRADLDQLSPDSLGPVPVSQGLTRQ